MNRPNPSPPDPRLSRRPTGVQPLPSQPPDLHLTPAPGVSEYYFWTSYLGFPMRITSKGQVTIPIDMRRRLGLLPNTEVTFELEGKAVRVRKAEVSEDSRGRQLVRRIRGRASVAMSTDEIMALTRGDE